MHQRHALPQPDARLIALLQEHTIDAVVSDVDGTLTDGCLTAGSDGTIARRFHTRDGMGHNILHAAGVKIAWLSATSEGKSVAARAKMIRVQHVDTGSGDKGPRLEALCEAMGVPPERTAYIGDDINDLPAMERAALAFCPSDAVPEVRSACDYVLSLPGGEGAFREMADAIVAAKGLEAAKLG